jgi:hypothetical protein
MMIKVIAPANAAPPVKTAVRTGVPPLVNNQVVATATSAEAKMATRMSVILWPVGLIAVL